MASRESVESKLSASRISTLRKMKFSERSPGPLLANVNTLIDLIGDGLTTTSEYFVLPLRVLMGFNAAMVDPLPHDLKRPQLRSFPTLLGLFLLLRSCGLVVGVTNPKRLVKVNPAMLDQWRTLNSTEQYFSLLSSFLYDANWDTVGMQIRYGTGFQSEIQYKLPSCIRVMADESPYYFGNIETSVMLELLHQFGWCKLEYEKIPQPGKAALLRRIDRTAFGDAMMAATCDFKGMDLIDSNSLYENLQPIFPDWIRMLAEPPLEFRDGKHIFKVSIVDVWRRIEAPANATLEELAEELIAAFEFSNDHLYQFELRSGVGARIGIGHAELDDADYFADEMKIGELPLPIGESMFFHYDFGDNWYFDVKLESIAKSNVEAFQIIESKGDSPSQYGEDVDGWYDDEDDYEEEDED